MINLMLKGVNMVGAEWSWDAAKPPPVENTNYVWNSHQDIDYVASKGYNYARMTFSWEILQPTLNGALATAYNTTMQDRVAYITSKGMYCMVEIHGGAPANFVRYKGNLVGTAAVPNAAFADLWSKVAAQYKANPKVIFGLSNEPNAMSTVQWYAAAQAAIDAIRATGATNTIFVPGNGYSQPSTWNDTWYDTAATKVSNAVGWLTLKDPLNNLVVSVHTYFDADGGGWQNGIVSPTIMQERLKPVVDWARKNKLKVHLSEFGANANDAGAQVAVTNALKWMDANSDVMLGWAWWTYGPPAWWGNYTFTLSPKSNYTVDDPKIAWLVPYLGQPTPPVVVPPIIQVPNMRPTAVTQTSPGDASYTALKTVSTGSSVPAAVYSLTVSTKTIDSDEKTFTVDMIFSNPSTAYDCDWTSMTVDMRGHTLNACIGCVVSGSASAPIITLVPTSGSVTVPSKNKTAIGLSMTRNPVSGSGANQLVVKSLTW